MADTHNRDRDIENPVSSPGSVKRNSILSLVITLFVVLLILFGVFLYRGRQIRGLEKRIGVLEGEVQKRDREIERLERLLSPFRTIALKRYPGTEGEALSKLVSRFWELELSPDMLNDYNGLASLDFMGRPLKDSEALSTPVSEMLEGVVTYDSGKDTYFWLCGPEPEAKYRAVIGRYPKFPFSYYCLSTCLLKRGDKRWRYYARRSLQILEQTTGVRDHMGIHDVIKGKLLLLLGG